MLLSRALRLGDREVVSLVGGGGKTTAMFRLADEVAASGGRSVSTTTTRIFAAQTALAPAHIVAPDGTSLPADLDAQLAAHGHVLVTGPVLASEGKAAGVEPVLVARLAARPDINAVIVEADGSRMRPLKAPAEHEPVVPAETTLLVPVAGADVIGRALDDTSTHRAELIAPLAGLRSGQPITPEAVAALLAHPQGGRKGQPPGARVVLLVNKAGTPERLAAARAVASRALKNPVVESVVLANAAEADPVREVWGRAVAVVLAAGAATRMGQLKQVLPWQGTTLVGRAADTALASEAAETLVVVGSEAERVVDALAGRPVRIVRNPAWAEGQSTSVRAALAALPPGCSAAIFLVADQPYVTPDVLDGLIQRHRETLAPIVAPCVRGRRVNPTLFDRSTWPALAAISGDSGGRALFEAYREQVAWLDWNTDIGIDVDTPEEYRALSVPAGR